VLLCLPLLWRSDRDAARPLVPRFIARFSRFALAASALVVLSGVVQAALEVGSWPALFTTGYGEMVLFKVGLLGAMLALALVNTRHASTRGVRAELALGLVVLAVAALLTGTPPSRGA
jgi:putative copper export protein